MRIQSLLACASAVSFVASQAGDIANGLARARAEFASADRDGDGRVTFAELRERRIVVSEVDFRAEDVDLSGAWSRDEFTVQFRMALTRAGRRAAPDLESEVARILGLRRARTVDAARAGQGPAAARLRTGASGATPELLELDANVARALSDLEDRAAGRGAVRNDFERVRSGWNERATRARALEVAVHSSPDPSQPFLAALDTLEAKARAGSIPRADFAPLRAAWEQRPRREIDPKNTSARPDDPRIESRFGRALDALEKQAVGRIASAADWSSVDELVVERVRRSVQGAEPSLPANDDPRVVAAATELREILARLQVRARDGALAPADFQEIRARYPNPDPRGDPPAPSDRDRPR